MEKFDARLEAERLKETMRDRAGKIPKVPGVISIVIGASIVVFTLTRFLSHALNDHDAFLNAELLLAITFLTGTEREHLIAILRPRWALFIFIFIFQHF